MNKQNNSLKQILGTIWRHPHFLPFILFTFIFTVYFSSSVGLMNSVDTPQFFTAEAIIQNKNIDMSVFSKNPFYYVWPDFFSYQGKILNFRGYFVSLISTPLHIISKNLLPLISINNFPINNNLILVFKYQLLVVSLFTAFSVIGIFFCWKTLNEILNNKKISTIIALLIAFGTYHWKYSATYSRQPIISLILGMSIFFIWRIIRDCKRKKEPFYLIPLTIMWALTFNIDPIIFLIFALTLPIFIAYLYLHNKNINNKIVLKRNILISVLIFSSILLLSMISNYLLYGDIFSNHSTKCEYIFKGIKIEKRNSVMMSSPLHLSLPTVLFNVGKIHDRIFVNYLKFPDRTSVASSVAYAKQYNFFGIFVISPFILFGFLLYKGGIKKYILLLIYSWFVFLVGIAINSMFFAFWGGNQYDVRYFYPYTLLLSVPLGVSLNYMIQLKQSFTKKWLFFIFFLLSAFSLLMSWLGVISMYKPALTGERRIWMDIYDLPTKFFTHSFREYLDATFMNRENAWIAIVLSIGGYALYQIISSLSRYCYFIFFVSKKRVS